MRDRRDAGFTLIEMLVSLALLSVTSVLLLAAVTTGRGIERRAETAALAGESVAAAQGLLRNRIEAMVPEGLYGGGEPRADVRGDGSVLSFTAPPVDGDRPAPPQRFRLLLTRAGELSLFSIDPLSTRANPDAPQLIGWTRAPLLGNVASLDIGYFGVHPPDNTRRWRSFWQDRPAPPELVRIRIGFGPGDRRFWPDLIIRPAATVNTACRIKPATGRCRAGTL